jgi:hypothetical protein
MKKGSFQYKKYPGLLVIILDDIYCYWLVLYGLADVRIFPEKKGGRNKPHEEKRAFIYRNMLLPLAGTKRN